MLIYGLVVAVLVLLVAVATYAWYRARGSTPPEQRDEGKPAPSGRDRTWDPHERYDEQAGRHSP